MIGLFLVCLLFIFFIFKFTYIALYAYFIYQLDFEHEDAMVYSMIWAGTFAVLCTFIMVQFV